MNQDENATKREAIFLVERWLCRRESMLGSFDKTIVQKEIEKFMQEIGMGEYCHSEHDDERIKTWVKRLQTEPGNNGNTLWTERVAEAKDAYRIPLPEMAIVKMLTDYEDVLPRDSSARELSKFISAEFSAKRGGRL